jgi:hypothetical protein
MQVSDEFIKDWQRTDEILELERIHEK